MSDDSDKHTRHYEIGVVRTSLQTTVRGLADEYASLYRDFETGGPVDGEIRLSVRPKAFSLRHRRRYDILANGRLQFEPARGEGVLPYVEWASNLEIARTLPGYLHLHAASMEVDGGGVIFPGTSGSGKSTLTAALLARGWRYLSDEFAMISTKTLRLHPYPRAISIKEPSIPVIESLGLRLHRNRRYKTNSKGPIGFISPSDLGVASIGRSCRVRHVIFPKYARGARPALIELTRAEAAFALHSVCFNLLACGAIGTDILAGVVRGAKCYRLVSGEIGETCNLLTRLVQSEGRHRALSA